MSRFKLYKIITILLISYSNLGDCHQNGALWKKEIKMKFGYGKNEINFIYKKSKGSIQILLTSSEKSLGSIKSSHLNDIFSIDMNTVSLTRVDKDTVKLSFYFNKIFRDSGQRKYVKFYFRRGKYLGKSTVIPRKNAAPSYLYTDIKLGEKGRIIPL